MARGLSLHLGLNAVDPGGYDGWDGALGACEADAVSMEAICAAAGFRTKVLLTAEATRDAFLAEARSMASNVVSGDTVVISYSGHGGQLPDINRDEDDRLDETWCLYDAQLIDDELYMLWSEFPVGARIVVFSDSCHSGTVLRNSFVTAAGLPVAPPSNLFRAMPPSIQRRAYAAKKEFYDKLLKQPPPPPEPAASVVLISGCQDNQLSQDGIYNGAFTGALLEVWDNGRFKGGYEDFVKKIRKLLPSSQSPNLMSVGPQNDSFIKGQVLSGADPASAQQ